MSKDKYKVLLVDDSLDDRFFMRTILERSSKFVVIWEAHDGQEAIDYLKTESAANILPDILLIDLKMPGKNGFDVLQWLLTQNLGNLAVAVMSGSWLADDIAKSLALGAHAYFKKTSLKEEQERMISDMERLLEERKSTTGH